MRYVVWVDAWQLQCCGEPFSIDDLVTWTLSGEPDREWLSNAIGAVLAASVTHAEEHHGDRPESCSVTTGRVVGIKSAFCRFAPAPGDKTMLYPVRGSARLINVTQADGWESDSEEMRFNGYLVTIETDHQPR